MKTYGLKSTNESPRYYATAERIKENTNFESISMENSHTQKVLEKNLSQAALLQTSLAMMVKSSAVPRHQIRQPLLIGLLAQQRGQVVVILIVSNKR
jgi:hypothetical protein